MSLQKILIKYQEVYGPVIRLDGEKIIKIDLSTIALNFLNVDLKDTHQLISYVNSLLETHQATIGIGGYGENRSWYLRSPLFTSDEEPRTIHLGIDIWAPVGTPVFCPLQGKIHSFANNSAFGDFGPTIILEHNLENVTFFTLYAHLSLGSLSDLTPGANVNRGDKFCYIGDHTINGQWPPHLHFQIIGDMQGKQGDFFGVVAPSHKETYLNICPNPNLILKISELDK